MERELAVDSNNIPKDLFGRPAFVRPAGSLFKWVGNKFRMAQEIASFFPADMRTYHEVFLGSGAVLATVAPERGVAADTFKPLIEIWRAIQTKPEDVKAWYEERWRYMSAGDKRERYEEIKAAFNSTGSCADFLFLTRACYGGIVRFRKGDGHMSTPVGSHRPISPPSFGARVDEWRARVLGTEFLHADYRYAMGEARAGDVVYCDPPYSHSQPILYGAQDFDLGRLLDAIADCKSRGVRVALSIDGTKKSGARQCPVPMPSGLFERQFSIDVGRSMLRRFQMGGKTLESEVVSDRLLLTY